MKVANQAIFSVRETIYFPLENNKNVIDTTQPAIACSKLETVKKGVKNVQN